MVDLAKIRKKAKKGAAQGAEGRAQGAEVTVADDTSLTSKAQPVGQSPPATRNQQPATNPNGERGAASAEAPTTDNRQPTTTDKLERFKAEAGKRRETIATSAPDQPSRQQLELLTFMVAGESYAVDIESIVEIVPPRPVTRIPNADPTVVGIMSLRGTIVTLVDVRRKLGHREGTETPDTRIVVVDFHRETVGFAVDRVQRVVKISPEDVEPHPVVHATELEEAVRGVFRVTDALTILLDLDKLLDSHSSD